MIVKFIGDECNQWLLRYRIFCNINELPFKTKFVDEENQLDEQSKVVMRVLFVEENNRTFKFYKTNKGKKKFFFFFPIFDLALIFFFFQKSWTIFFLFQRSIKRK